MNLPPGAMSAVGVRNSGQTYSQCLSQNTENYSFQTSLVSRVASSSSAMTWQISSLEIRRKARQACCWVKAGQDQLKQESGSAYLW